MSEELGLPEDLIPERYCKSQRSHRLYRVMGLDCPCEDEIMAMIGHWLEGSDPRSETEIQALLEEWKLP